MGHPTQRSMKLDCCKVLYNNNNNILIRLCFVLMYSMADFVLCNWVEHRTYLLSFVECVCVCVCVGGGGGVSKYVNSSLPR